MKSKKRKIFLVGIIGFFIIILVFPIRMVYLDGGTATYSAILYKVIHWNGFSDNYFSGRKNGWEIIWFPNNFHSLSYYKKLEPIEIYAHTEYIGGSFFKDYSDSGIKYVKCNIGSYSLLKNVDGKKFTSQNTSIHPVLQDYLNVLEVKANDMIYVARPIENIQVYKLDSLIPFPTNVQFDDSYFGIALKDLDYGEYIISFQYKHDSNNLTTYSFKINVT